jgi:hypothetical protein
MTYSPFSTEKALNGVDGAYPDLLSDTVGAPQKIRPVNATPASL